MSTERERYDEWRDKQDGSFNAFDVWNAAVKNERERCARLIEERKYFFRNQTLCRQIAEAVRGG